MPKRRGGWFRTDAAPAAVVSLMIAGCQNSDIAQGPYAVRDDSAGVEIVRNYRPVLAEEEGWRISAPPFVTIGTNQSDTAGVLWDVKDGAILAGDTLIALLLGDGRTVRIYNVTGHLIRSVGRPGRGPGEFLYPQALFFKAPDSMYVWDGHYSGASVYRTSGEYVRSEPIDYPAILAALPVATRSEQYTPLPMGGLLLHVTPATPAPPRLNELVRSRIGFVYVNEQYQPRLYGWYEGREMMLVEQGEHPFILLPAYPAKAVVAVSRTGNAVYISNGDQYAVDRYEPSGGLVRRITRPDFKTALPRADRAAALEWVVSRNARSDEAAQLWRRLNRSLPAQEYYPAVRDMFVDTEENLWILEGKRRWAVFDHSGQLLQSVLLPFDRILDRSACCVLGLSRDNDGVESVSLYPLLASVHN